MIKFNFKLPVTKRRKEDLVLHKMLDRLMELDPESEEFKALVKETENFTQVREEQKNSPIDHCLKFVGTIVPAATTILVYFTSIGMENSEFFKPSTAKNIERIVSPFQKK